VNITEGQSETAFTGKQLHILDAAERLFGNRGFEGTSVRDIAQFAWMTNATNTAARTSTPPPTIFSKRRMSFPLAQ